MALIALVLWTALTFIVGALWAADGELRISDRKSRGEVTE
jgi:hypothetical protein